MLVFTSPGLRSNVRVVIACAAGGGMNQGVEIPTTNAQCKLR